MTTQGHDDDDAANSDDASDVLNLPLTGSELTRDLAVSHQLLVKASGVLEAALAESAKRSPSKRLEDAAKDLGDAANQVARAQRLAEGENHRTASVKRDNEVLAARVIELQAEVRTLRAQSEAGSSIPANSGAEKTRPAPLRSRLKNVLRSAMRKRRSRQTSTPGLAEGEAAAAIESTGLFDADWYLTKYPDIHAAGAAPLEHFLRHGGAEGRNPGPTFDTRWYVTQSPEVALSGLNPLVHYALFGKAQGLRPMSGEVRPEDDPDVILLLRSPLFDSDQYRTRVSGLGKGRHTVARHYLDKGWREGVNPSSDFDGNRYLDRHRDVKEAGVNPLVHYLRHGRDEGREVFPASTVKATEGRASTAHEPEPMQAWPWTRLDALQLNTSAPETLWIGDLAVGFSHAEDKTAIKDVLRTFERLTQPYVVAKDVMARFSSTRTPVVADAWFATVTTLRIRLVPSTSFASVVRCYQSAFGVVRLLSEQAVHADGLPLADVTLDNHFASLLVTVDDGKGEVSNACIIPFPSLARNGDHHAELAATANGAAPGALVSFGASMSCEWLEGGSAGDLTIGGVEVDLDNAIGGERVLGSSFLMWARAAMGVAVSCCATSTTEATSVLRSQLASINEGVTLAPRTSKGLVLKINGDELPALRSLVSRTLPPTAAGRAAFLVADVIRGKPRWLITPPLKGPDLSALQPAIPGAAWPSVKGTTTSYSTGDQPDFPIAIRFQEHSVFDEEAALLFPTSPDSAGPLLASSLPEAITRSPAVSVVLSIDAHIDASAALASLSSVLGQSGSLVEEIILVLRETRDDLVSEAHAAVPGVKILVSAQRSAGLNRAVDLASGAYLLMMDAGVILHDRRTLQTLLTLAASSGVSSASCAMVEQAKGRNGQKVSWVSGGVFPSHIDLIARPTLAFGEPQAPAALPAATYGVACNRMRLALIPSQSWNDLGGLDDVNFPDRDYDLDFSLRALEAGSVNLCTTAVTALLLTHIRMDNSIDPGSEAMLSISAWGRALERMTLLRDLG